MLLKSGNHREKNMLKLSYMDNKCKPGDTVYLIGNSHFIEEATVVMTVAGFVIIRFTERGGGNPGA